jgi:hypothetical protein
MHTELIRIGTGSFVNETELNKDYAFDLLFGGFHEFVYIPDYWQWQLVNGTWAGALGHLMNDTQMWIGSSGTRLSSKCTSNSHWISSYSVNMLIYFL